jgi:hypothetical protein
MVGKEGIAAWLKVLDMMYYGEFQSLDGIASPRDADLIPTHVKPCLPQLPSPVTPAAAKVDYPRAGPKAQASQ